MRRDSSSPPLSRWRASPSFALPHLQARCSDRDLHVALIGDLNDGVFEGCLGEGVCVSSRFTNKPLDFQTGGKALSRRPSKSSMTPFRDPSHPVERASLSMFDWPRGEWQRGGAAWACSARGFEPMMVGIDSPKLFSISTMDGRALQSKKKKRPSPAPACTPSADALPT